MRSLVARWALVGVMAASAGAVGLPRSRTVAPRSARLVQSPCPSPVRLSAWTPSRLAAQLVAVPIPATAIGAVAPETRTGFGGILVFGSSAPPSMGSTLRRLESSAPQGLGLLVMTDEEGGGVRRLDNLVGAFPWARSMAASMAPGAIRALARRVGMQLAAAGINTDLAPVLDVDGRDVAPGPTDPDGWRSFGGSPQVVSADGTAFMSGLLDARVLPVVKHFPGLGGSTGNTDDGPAATLPWPALESSALLPFRAAIRQGAPAIMVSNARVPGLSALPASLSGRVIDGVLRNQLGFKGLIVTDSLTAGAIAAAGLSVPQAALAAVKAGADLVLLGAQRTVIADRALADSVSGAIKAGLASGAVSRATLQDAVSHVLAAKGEAQCIARTDA